MPSPAVRKSDRPLEPNNQKVRPRTGCENRRTGCEDLYSLHFWRSPASGEVRAQDAAAGEKVFGVCKACHQIGETAKNNVGPSPQRHHRPQGGHRRRLLTIRAANKDSGITWDEATFREYIKDPKAKIPGTKMIYAGLKDEQKTNDLRRLSQAVRCRREEEIELPRWAVIVTSNDDRPFRLRRPSFPRRFAQNFRHSRLGGEPDRLERGTSGKPSGQGQGGRTAYGAGFFDIPGTDTCIKIGGYLR